MVMLLATVAIGALLVQQTQSLQSSVAITQEAVDSNIRTLSQVQRELLRLDVLLNTTPLDKTAIDLTQSLVDQRVQEGSLPYQLQALGTPELLAQSQALARRWASSIRPVVTMGVVNGDPQQLAVGIAEVVALEKDYNQLVSDGEISRKLRAGNANGAAQQLVSTTSTLMVGLGVTAAFFLLFMAVAGLATRRARKRQEAAAAELVAVNEELRTHALVVHATDNLVITTDATGRIDWVNEAFTRTTGHALESVVGRRPGEVLQGPDTEPGTVALMRAALTEGQGFATDVMNYSASGRAYWVHIEAFPVLDETGKVTRFVAIETDITDRRFIEDNLRKATETALQLAEEKTGFLATMSHEIRTPLNAVLGVTSLLQGTALDDEQQEYVSTALRSGQLLLELVNDILNFSALDSGRIEIENRRFSVARLVGDIQAMFAATAAASDVSFSADVAADLPQFVSGDENRIRQVLINLVANGIKFTPEGVVRLLVDRDPKRAGGLRFRVEDSGIGIAADRQDRIFLPFTQVDASTTRKYGGSGLGLSICRLIAQHLVGSLELKSTPGEGSTFTFWVPVATVDPVELLTTSGDSTAVVDMTVLRVLLAEDDATNRMVALRMLSRLGATAVVAKDGAEAVAAFADQDFEVVLMDVHMPRMDGIAATKGIQELAAATGRHRPLIVAVTANALEGDSERLLAAGMDGYISKPVTLKALGALLAAATKGERLPHGRSWPSTGNRALASSAGPAD